MNLQTATRAAETIPETEIEAKTGKSCKAWIALLDHVDMSSMTYEQVAASLGVSHDLGPWWRHILAARYIQALEMRQKQERPNGFEFSVSRTIDVSAPLIYRVLTNAASRTEWLGGNPVAPRRSIPDRAFRAAWLSDSSFIDITLTPKGETRCLVTVQHSRLANADRAAEMKSFWTTTLVRLESVNGSDCI